MPRPPISRTELLRRTFGPREQDRGGEGARPAPPVPAKPGGGTGDALAGHVLELRLGVGETAHLRRSSLLLAEGAFELTTHRIASRRLPILGLFSGQNLLANRFEARTPTRIIAGRDYHGVVLALDVAPERPVYLQPALYLGHEGELAFTVKRVARREFWTLTRVCGAGTVHIKAPGRVFETALPGRELIVDTNYVAAIRGEFEADGKVFRAGQYLKSGEAENVRLAGEGAVLMQTELPPAASGGGGLLGSLVDLVT